MGIDTGCMLIVGLKADDLADGVSPELRQKIDKQGFYDVLSEDGELGLESASPHYDSDYDVRVWGVAIESAYWNPIEIDEGTLPEKIKAAKDKFREKTGLEGRLFVSAHVT